MDPVTTYLIAVGIVTGVPTSLFGTLTSLVYINFLREPKEHLSAEQWEDLWKTKKEWLASVITQKNTLSTAETLEEFARILTFSGAPIKGYGSSLAKALRNGSTARAQMCLTFIPYESGSNWYRNYNYTPRKGGVNETLRSAVQGLRTLAEKGEESSETQKGWDFRLTEFVRNYASHLLLNYRELKEDKFEAESDWEETVWRQKLLNAEMELLLQTLPGKASSPTARGLEKAILAAREIEATKDGNVLSLEALTAEEREVIQAFRSRKETLALPAQVTGEALIQKMRTSAEVSSEGGGPTPQVIVEIAGENRSIATLGLGRILEKEEDSCRVDLVKQLRADNLYLKQKSEELHQS